MCSADPIDALLDQAAAHAARHLADETFVDFSFAYPRVASAADVLAGRHALVEARHCNDKTSDGDEGGQWGMFAKRDVEAGTTLVVAKPIVVLWDVEDDADDGSDDDVEDEEEGASDANNGDGSYDGSDDSDSKPEALDRKPSAEKASTNGKMGADLTASENEGSMSNGDGESIPEPTGTKRNGVLILRALQKIKEDPSLWTDTLSTLFPRDADAALNLPPWFCGDPSVGMEIERRMTELPDLSLFPSKENEEVCQDIATRLPLIVRYNVLSIETSSELFVYPDVSKGGLASLAGTGLYGPEVSYFNHSCAPNVSRYCIGDVMFFVTNRGVQKGEELCFSYIEHEYLCENAVKRSALLDMDFELDDDDRGERPTKRQKVAKMPSTDEDEVQYPLIDAEMQSELMAEPPMERLDLLNELLLVQKADPVRDYQCDKYQLRILKAITLDGLGKSKEALAEWEMALKFAVENFPPIDETTTALRVQAALCAINSNRSKAKLHAHEALRMHNLLFGGGTRRFLKRYEKEFACLLRPIAEAARQEHVHELFGGPGG